MPRSSFGARSLAQGWAHRGPPPNPPGTSTRAVTQEFGTLPALRVARALISENMGFHYDRANHAHWRDMARDAFYVRTPEWKAKVLRRGHDVFNKFVSRAASAAAEQVCDAESGVHSTQQR